jgi:hypothetical protein
MGMTLFALATTTTVMVLQTQLELIEQSHVCYRFFYGYYMDTTSTRILFETERHK